ncbi:MAG: hypothetical protein K2O34_04790 [Acetatifactor sp.]|nr:hypothetical protein [Acetatifactor sp.]
MGDISTQQKLQLTRQVRERYYQDRQDLGQREQLLYGRPLSYFDEEPVAEYGDIADYGGRYGGNDEKAGTLGLRILLAAVLLCLLVLMDRRGDTLFGLTGRQIGEYIRLDYTSQP